MTAQANLCQDGNHVFRFERQNETNTVTLYRDPYGCVCGLFLFSGYRDGKATYSTPIEPHRGW